MFVAENSQRQKTKWKVEFLAYTALIAVNGKQFILKIALDIKRRFNKATSSYILPQLFAVFLFYFLAVTRRDFLYHCKRRIFDGLFKPSGARNCDSPFPLFLFLVFAPNTDFVTISCEVFITNADIL